MTQRTVGAQITNYIYDIQDRLERVEDGSSSVIAEYYYDPFGRRLWKEVSGVRTYYFYSEEGLIAEYDASGTEIKTYGYGPDSTWGTNPMFQKVGSSYYWYINDHLGTPQVIIDTTGRVMWAATYDSFGNAQISTEDITNNLRFAGQYYDGETGLHYNWFRYYDPQTGRYLRTDPIGFFGGDLNLYAYVGSDPNIWIDPWGLARYYVNYTIKSYGVVIAPVGMTTIKGIVVSTQRNRDGTFNAIEFEGKFYGEAFGPLPWASTVNNEEYFEDNCEKADVTNIAGRSWFLSGSMALYNLGVSGGAYRFGSMRGTKETPSKAQGLDLGVDFMMGRTWTKGPIIKVYRGIFPENR